MHALGQLTMGVDQIISRQELVLGLLIHWLHHTFPKLIELYTQMIILLSWFLNDHSHAWCYFFFFLISKNTCLMIFNHSKCKLVETRVVWMKYGFLKLHDYPFLFWATCFDFSSSMVLILGPSSTIWLGVTWNHHYHPHPHHMLSQVVWTSNQMNIQLTQTIKHFNLSIDLSHICRFHLL